LTLHKAGEWMKNNIKELRAERRLTQDQLAAQLDVSRQTIISLERERYNPSINLAFKIARVFQCSIEDIFIYEEDNE
jgi:putative transcriptional regulator